MYREAPIVSDDRALVANDLSEDTKRLWPGFGGNVIVTEHYVQRMGAARGRVELGTSLEDRLLTGFHLAVICCEGHRDPACVWVQQRIKA
jgi:hypothetical protein